MKNSTVDIYVYIHSKPQNHNASSLINVVNQMAGVVTAKMNQHVKQLMAVKYNPAHVSSQTILTAIKQKGSTAALVGM